VKKNIIAYLFIALFVLAACSNLMQPSPIVIPTLTFTTVPTLAPTNTPLPAKETPEDVSEPGSEGQPAPEWNGIPIMPDAIAGEGDEESYVYTLKATPQQVQEYYQLELGKLGWQPFAISDEDAALMLMFMNKTSGTLTVSIIAKGDQALVLLVK
jgi:hypothetical protein